MHIRFLAWSVDYCKFHKLSQTSVNHLDLNVRNDMHIIHWPIITPTSYRHARPWGISSQETPEDAVYRLKSNHVASRKVDGKNNNKKQTFPYQSSVHRESVVLPFMHHTRHVPTSSAVHPPPYSRIFSGTNCAALIQIYFNTLDTMLNKMKLFYILLSMNMRKKREKEHDNFFYCLPIMHLACNVWCVCMLWGRGSKNKTEIERATRQLSSDCQSSVFSLSFWKGTVQWIVCIGKCLSYICQCSFFFSMMHSKLIDGSW